MVDPRIPRFSSRTGRFQGGVHTRYGSFRHEPRGIDIDDIDERYPPEDDDDDDDHHQSPADSSEEDYLPPRPRDTQYTREPNST